jgi:ribonuclease HI
MKTLKFKSELADSIKQGIIVKTWRLFDDKQLEVDDILQFIDSDNKIPFGYARINKITAKRIADVNKADMQGRKIYQNIDEIIEEFKKYYGDKVNAKSIVKIVDFAFFDKQPELKAVNMTTPITEVKIYTDGGSRGNPGPSACGFIITDKNDNMIQNDGAYLGITTNNQAEYQAVLKSLKNAKNLGAIRADIYMDSLLVVNQMNGSYKVKNRDLLPIYLAVKEELKKFDIVTFTHIPRAMNQMADSRVNEILDKHK